MENDFDLIGPLWERAQAAWRNAASEAAGEAHRTAAQDALARRALASSDFNRGLDHTALDYEAGPELCTAVNVALRLGRPLLFTGEPGSGKTQAAFWLAQVLGLGEVLKVHVTSESRAQDLLYRFDAASWFRETQVSALRGKEARVPKAGFVEAGPLGEAFGWRWAPDGTVREPDGKPRLVLIDEIDKAPRDFPNDLLWVIDQMNFRVPEIEGENEVACPADRRPVVVITSNEERRLPGPFLRRCVQHRIELDSDAVKRILTARLIGKRPGRDALDAGEERLLRAAVGAWDAIRATRGLSRPYTIDEVWRHIALAARHRAGPQAREGLAVDLEGRDPERLRAVLRTLLPPADLDLVQPVVAAQAASG